MEERTISEKESLVIIQQMIQTAKTEQKDDGKGWIFWGWLLFAASILTYLNIQFRWYATFFFWNLFGGATLAFFIYQAVRKFFFDKIRRVKTYTGDLFEKLNVGFFIFLFFIILAMNLGIGPERGFALLIALYGFWVLIYGTALNFRPSIIAAFITWGIGFATLFVHEMKWTMLLHALAVFCGYIIPGHLANQEFKKVKRAIA